MSNWKVPQLWLNGECFIIGGGKSMPYQFGIPEKLITEVCQGKKSPSAYSPYMSVLHDKHVIGTNNAYMLGDWIDFLMFVDGTWYSVHRRELSKWAGIRVSCAARFVKKPEKMVKFLKKDNKHFEGLSLNSSRISWNKNSGGAAINLAYHLGVKTVYLLGFDMKTIDPKYTHWHGMHYHKNKEKRNKKVLKPIGGAYSKHLRGFPAIAADAKKVGLNIINLSKDSAISHFPKMSLSEVLK